MKEREKDEIKVFCSVCIYLQIELNPNLSTLKVCL